MGTSEMTGTRRHYQVVDCGQTQLRRLLEVVFTDEQQPTHFACTSEGVFATSSVDVIAECCEDGEEVFSLSAGDYCWTVSSGAIDFFERMSHQEREIMVGSWPTRTGDCPRTVGWRLDVHGRKDGVILVQIRPAWWS